MDQVSVTQKYVIEINKSKAKVVAQDISLISTYHSFQFTEKAITLWRYYGTGKEDKIQ